MPQLGSCSVLWPWRSSPPHLTSSRLDIIPGWVVAAAFAGGGLLYLLADWVVDRLSGGGSQARMWMIYLAVAVDLFADGLMVGAGSSIGAGLGLALALGQVLADLPEGAAVVMTLKANEMPRSKRVLVSAGLFIPAVVGTLLSYLLLRGAGQATQAAALVVTAGLLAVAGLEDMIKEAHQAEADTRMLTVSLILGFSVFTLVSAGLG